MARTVRQDIAAEVRAECARQNKTHQDIADILGITQPSVSLRMQGHRAFRAEELAAIAEALGVPVATFIPVRVEAIERGESPASAA